MKWPFIAAGVAAAILAGDSAHAARRSPARKNTPKAAQKAIPSPPAPNASWVRLPPMKYTDERLPNGLRVLMLPDPSAPTVAVVIGYHVGGKDDPPGRSGFAHLFEHMMFKGSANTGPDTMTSLTEDVGGYGNAGTSPDLTYYYNVIPSNYLEPVLWAEADRMASLDVEENAFKTEREVVLREYGQRVLGNPYGPLELLSEREAFRTHPYGRGSIGTPEDLNAATLEEVRAFHRTYYRPDNAVMAIVGDFSPERAREWVGRYFGRIPKSDTPIPRVTRREPPQAAERRVTRYDANVPLPFLTCIYRAVPAASPDAAALEVLAALLTAGQSALLNQNLIYHGGIASSASAESDLREDHGLFTIGLLLSKDDSHAQTLAALDREIAQLRAAPVSRFELDKAKAQLLTDEVMDREGNMDRAGALVSAALLFGDPGRANTWADEIRAVTAQDVQRVARMYLKPSGRTVIAYLPESMRPKAKPAKKAPVSGKRPTRKTSVRKRARNR